MRIQALYWNKTQATDIMMSAVYKYKILSTVLLLLTTIVQAQLATTKTTDYGLVPPVLKHAPLPEYDYSQLDYGMNMGLEQTNSGRIWSCWTAGGDDPNAFMLLMYSDNDGVSWSKPALVIDAQDPNLNSKRAVQNGNLWKDPLDRLWLFFDQSMNDFDGRAGVWYSVCVNPDDNKPVWSSPKRIWHGTAKSKPVVLSSGAWLLPVSLLNRNIIDRDPPTFRDAYGELDSLRMAHVFITHDNGVTWTRQGGIQFPDASYDEHHVVQLRSGELWMTARTNNGIWQSSSPDEGKTWSTPRKFLSHVSSRHFIRRLQSGNIILVKHGDLEERTKTRSKLMAFLSSDDGQTWKGGLMLDERRGISYPDGFEAANGMIYISYDRNRATDGHILMTKFNEHDILDKEFKSSGSRQKQLIAAPAGLDKLQPPSINSLSKATTSQPVPATQDFAVVVSQDNNPGKKAIPGAKVFYDRNYVFEKLPAFLSGMDYIATSMTSHNRVIPVTEGYVYMVTPLAGQAGSQEEQLVAMGFARTEHNAFALIKDQSQQVGVFKKYIAFDKFRLGHIEYDGWAVPFFKKRTLPSVTAPARFKWMPQDEFTKEARKWQGCPSIEITGKRFWGTWFSGGDREPDKGNYGIVGFTDDGKNWIDPAMIIYHTDTNVRVMDTELWKDPQGRLWIFWTQNTGAKGFDGLWGTWAIYSENPEAKVPRWSTPKRLCNGLTRNKPVVLSTGEWLLPSYDWIRHQSAMYISKDQGKTWKLQGGPINPPIDNFYEHMCVELKNGDVWMLQRNIQGSISKDKGVTWSALDSLSAFASANSRLFLGRLRSGRLLLIYNNDNNNKRKNLTAFLSEDDGKTWPHQLLLDERDNVSYPEAVQDEDGRIYVCYDRSRTGEKEILLVNFSEEEIMKGAFMSGSSIKKSVISKVGK